MNTDIPAVVINLARSRDRRAHMEAQLKGSGLAYSFFEAVDGAKLTPSELALYDEQAAVRFVNRPLTRGEIGCALSHVRIYEWMVKKRLPRLLIMEDDVSLKEHFFTAIAHADQWLPPKWGIINFLDTSVPDLASGASFLYRYMIRVDTVSGAPNHYVYYFTTVHQLAICYLIHLQAAERLLALAYPIRMAADTLTGLISLNKLRAYTILPRLVEFLSTQSAIDEVDARPPLVRPSLSLAHAFHWSIYRAWSLTKAAWKLMKGYIHLAPRYPTARAELVQRIGFLLRRVPYKVYQKAVRNPFYTWLSGRHST